MTPQQHALQSFAEVWAAIMAETTPAVRQRGTVEFVAIDGRRYRIQINEEPNE